MNTREQDDAIWREASLRHSGRQVRCVTPEMKRDLVERLLALWEQNPQLRLGQLITTAFQQAEDLRRIEDLPLIERLESL